MSLKLSRPTNGISFGKNYTVTAQDATDGEAIIDFQVDYPLAAVVQITRSGEVATSDAVITFPANGQVSIADGSTYSVTEDDVISVIANRDGI